MALKRPNFDKKGNSGLENAGTADVENFEARETAQIPEKKKQKRDANYTAFVRNLDYKVAENDLREAVLSVCPVLACTIVRDKKDQSSRGFGFVHFYNEEDREKACVRLNGHLLKNRRIVLEKAFAKSPPTADIAVDRSLDVPVEDTPELSSSEEPISDEGTLDASFTAAQRSLAEKAAAKVLNLRPKQVEKPGVASEKSNELIVKNLSFKATKEALFAAFKPFGLISKVALSKPSTVKKIEGKTTPHGGFAFVTYRAADDAAKACAAMNNKQLCGKPLQVSFKMDADAYKALSKQAMILKSDSRRPLDRLRASKIAKEDWRDDACEGKTVHLRNIPLDATPEEIKTALTIYGDVIYVRKNLARGAVTKSEGEGDAAAKLLVSSPSSTAFVKFRDREVVERLLQIDRDVESRILEYSRKGVPNEFANSALEGMGILIKGRRVRVALALPRGELEEAKTARQIQLVESKSIMQKNANLLEIGRIAPGTHDAQGMSKSDAQKRAIALKEEHVKLNNPNYIVNPLRLCVRNLPLDTTAAEMRDAIRQFCITDTHVRQLIMNAANSDGSHTKKKPTIRTAVDKVFIKFALVFEKSVEDLSKKGKSRGFGYATFTDHNVATKVLLHLNNNAELFGDKRRPIVSFAVEDKRALRHREKLLEKLVLTSQSRLSNVPQRKSKMHSRGRRQRERKRKLREEVGKT